MYVVNWTRESESTEKTNLITVDKFFRGIDGISVLVLEAISVIKISTILINSCLGDIQQGSITASLRELQS
jgi:hypothetical protein